ncbi:MAG: hypothetical protein OEY29_14865 [Gammaproteobacteria bacterium]|nr:hypothetical protein [Gammaproteobacteria bacterium]
MDIIEKQLDYLNETMKQTAADANSFLLKYHFGGLIAVIALLNADLVLADRIIKTASQHYAMLSVAVMLIFSLSFCYFYIVLMHYRRFARSHRKLKYKYELTLHCSLSNGDYRDYQFYLEKSVSDKTSGQKETEDKLNKPEEKDYPFTDIAEYLLNHHRIKYNKLEKVDLRYLLMALSVIALTVSIRVIFIMAIG